MPPLFTKLCNTKTTPWIRHAHRCPNCRLIWEHDPSDPAMHSDAHTHDKAHDCPHCGTSQFYIYRGEEESACLYNGLQVIHKYIPYKRLGQ